MADWRVEHPRSLFGLVLNDTRDIIYHVLQAIKCISYLVGCGRTAHLSHQGLKPLPNFLNFHVGLLFFSSKNLSIFIFKLRECDHFVLILSKYAPALILREGSDQLIRRLKVGFYLAEVVGH